MSFFRSLGSTIPDPVIVDVASFFADEELFGFNLASPKAHSLSMRNRIYQKDIDKLDISRRCTVKVLGEIHIKYGDNEMSLRDMDRAYETRKVGNILRMFRSIGHLKWGHVAIDDELMKTILKLKTVGEIDIFITEVLVSPSLFRKFLERYPNVADLGNVELSGNLINDQNMKLLRHAHVFCSWRREGQTYEQRKTEITDDFLVLEENAEQIPFSFDGFYTNFTVKAIEEFCEDTECKVDFGTIGFDQLSAAIDFDERKTNVKNKRKLYSWNGQKTLFFKIYSDDGDSDDEYNSNEILDQNWEYFVKFAISLVKDVSKPDIDRTSIPEVVVPANVLKAFDNYADVFTGSPTQLMETERSNMSMVYVYYSDIFAWSTNRILKIEYKLDSAPLSAVLVKTDLSEEEALAFIVEFFKGCGSIGEFHWKGLIFDDKYYEVLKPIVDEIEVENPWTMEVSLNEANFCQLFTNQRFFSMYYPRGLSEDLLTEKVLLLLVDAYPEVHIRSIFYLKSAKDHYISFSDNLLHSMVSKSELMTEFSAKYCITKLSANGLKTILQAFSPVTEDTYKYHLGTIHEDNVKEIEELIESFKDENPEKWDLNQDYKTDYNGKRSCVVTLKRKTTKVREKYNDEYATTTVMFEIIRKKKDNDETMPSADSGKDNDKEVVERKTRKRTYQFRI